MADLHLPNEEPSTTDRLDAAFAELDAAETALADSLAELAANLGALLDAIPVAPVLELDERWPDGWHGSESLHDYDHTPADVLHDHDHGVDH